MEIKLTDPYHYQRVLQRLSYDPLTVVDLASNTLKVPLLLYGAHVVATIIFAGDKANASCHIDIPTAYEEEGVRRITEIFQLEAPTTKISEHFAKTDLAPLVNQFAGLPLVRDFDLYYCMMKTIIHQQLNIRFAYTLTERFVKSYGSEIDGVWFYPSPETISKLNYEELRQLQFSQRKAEYVIDTSKLIVNGELDLTMLPLLSDEEVIELLIKIRGLGYWSAENILLFGLARGNLLPVKDIGIQNALKNFYGLDRKPTIEEILTLSEGWSPYKSYASLYLWESLDNQKARS